MASNENLKSEIVSGERWVECKCGAGEYLPKLLRHRRECRTQAQWADEPCRVTAPVDVDLNKFAANVRRTSLSKGRTEDLVNAVRTKRISWSDAMNTDD